MSLFNNLFKKKNDDEIFLEDNDKPIIDKEISIIINILASLGLLNEEEIHNNLSKDPNFDSSILKKLMIGFNDIEIPELEMYFQSTKLGYGVVKLKDIEIKLRELANEKINDGLNRNEVIEELIDLARDYIIYYERVLEQFNSTIEKLKETSTTEVDFIAMLDYWTNYYKEQELGYPINLTVKIDTLALELMQLPYGGYGIDEINKFKEAAYKMIEEGRLNGEEANHTLSRITASLFNPKKERYLEDVNTLERKLLMIQESFEITDSEKQERRLRTIKDFNILNGHQQDLDSYIEQLRKNLSILEYGGYGNAILDEFSIKANSIIEEGKKNFLSEEMIRREIHDEYQLLVNEYQNKLVILKSKIREIDQSDLDEDNKEKRKNDVLDNFHDEMGLPINSEESIQKMIQELKSLEHGGYGDLTIQEFNELSTEKLSGAKTKAEIRDALRDLNDIKEGLIKDYQKSLNNYYDSTERIMNSNETSSEDKETIIGDFEREFKFSVGYKMNFDKYIENRLLNLANLNNSGFGEKAIFEFREEFKKIADSIGDDRAKYVRIKQLFERLKEYYFENLRLFKEWVKLQLLERPEDIKELEKEALYMLSLSPKSFKEYLYEDEKLKKIEADRNNYEVAFKYLALKEANGDQMIYHRRMDDFKNNRFTYSDELINETISKLQFEEENTNKNTRIITITEYIDSTLIKQLTEAEASLNSKSE